MKFTKEELSVISSVLLQRYIELQEELYSINGIPEKQLSNYKIEHIRRIKNLLYKVKPILYKIDREFYYWY